MSHPHFTIKDELMHKIGKQVDKQTDKGVKKYGHSLDDCPYNEYDWLLMQNEELIDGIQYANKEIRRQRNIIRKLRDEK